MGNSMLHGLMVNLARKYTGLVICEGTLDMDGFQSIETAEGYKSVAWPTFEPCLHVKTLYVVGLHSSVYARHDNQVLVADSWGIRAWSERPTKYGEELYGVSPFILRSLWNLRGSTRRFGFGTSLSVNHYEESLRKMIQTERIRDRIDYALLPTDFLDDDSWSADAHRAKVRGYVERYEATL